MKNIDETIIEVSQTLDRRDFDIISRNAIDRDGNVAIIAGSPRGENPGVVIPWILDGIASIIIPVGLEKLIRETIQEAVKAAGRDKDLLYGMAVGLIPLIGQVLRDKDAVEILSNVMCTVIGS